MVEVVRGDMFEADVDALVNPVNCVGTMGKGLALQFKKRFPEAFVSYALAFKAGEVRPGRIHVGPGRPAGRPRLVLHFPTKRHWIDVSRLEDIEAGLVALAVVVKKQAIASLAIPALGCGLGGLRWADVRPRIELMALALEDVRVLVYEP